MFVTWIVSHAAALCPDYGLCWTEGVLTPCLHNYSEAQTPPSCLQNVSLTSMADKRAPGRDTWLHSLNSEYSYCVCRRICRRKYMLHLSVDSNRLDATVSVSVRAICLWWCVIMVMPQCVRCRRSEECHYWSCPGSPVRGGHASTLDNLTYNIHAKFNLLELQATAVTVPALFSYLLGHLVWVVQRVFPLQEHPLLLWAGQAAG